MEIMRIFILILARYEEENLYAGDGCGSGDERYNIKFREYYTVKIMESLKITCKSPLTILYC